MFDRVLSVDLIEFDKLTSRFKWRFFEVLDEDQIRVAVPKGDRENLVIYVGNLKETQAQLNGLGFIEQNIKQWRDW